MKVVGKVALNFAIIWIVLGTALFLPVALTVFFSVQTFKVLWRILSGRGLPA